MMHGVVNPLKEPVMKLTPEELAKLALLVGNAIGNLPAYASPSTIDEYAYLTAIRHKLEIACDQADRASYPPARSRPGG